MYIPAHFAENDLGRLHAAIEAYPFATLVSSGDDEMEASHLPLLLDRVRGPSGTLVGHMARANPQWRAAAGKQVLAIFHGPHVYISPAWYESSDVVPTWNYVAVHAYGTLTLIEDRSELAQLVARTVHHFESPRNDPWEIPPAASYLDRLLPQIVGFQIPIDRLAGKWKLNQNHPPARRQKVIAALTASKREDDRSIAALMKEWLLRNE